ncbi:MAG: hypothetical protein KME41_17595 [Candidatus Thiodiazotropha sp. (ex Lucina pensylvanica)]|nr:hypothetical protein [Candidatus Thiodiazotropha sp. (ex Lucina pensylvanica)]
MIKSLQNLFVNYERAEADRIVEMWMENPASRDWCRFTFGELQDKVKPRLDALFMRVSDDEFHQARQIYTAFELKTVDALSHQSGEERMERIKRDVATAVERTSRALADFLEVHEKEREIEQAYRDLQSKQTKYRNQNVQGSMARRFE